MVIFIEGTNITVEWFIEGSSGGLTLSGGDLYQDDSEYGASKQPINPIWSRIHHTLVTDLSHSGHGVIPKGRDKP